jgi:rod shape-determining protein MreC
MKKLSSRLLLIIVIIMLLYGVTRVRGVKIPLLETGISYCIYPLLATQRAIVNPVKQYFEVNQLQREVQALYVRCIAERQELLKENIELVSMLDVARAVQELSEFKKRYSSDALIAQVIGRQYDDRHFFWIDAGKNRGVEVDMVVVYKNCLIGRITEVYFYYSKVTLITDPFCKVAAFCKNSQEHAIHEGTGSINQTKLTYVFDSRLDLDKRLKKGDLVLTSGEGLIFPKGFGLGTIESFKSDDLQCNVTLTPLVDFNKIDYCSVIAKGAAYNESVDLKGDSSKNDSLKSSAPKAIKQTVKNQSTPELKSKRAPMPKVEEKSSQLTVEPDTVPAIAESKPEESASGHIFSPLKIADDTDELL